MAALVSHPAHPATLIRSVEARFIGHDAQWLRARWKILGAGALAVPAFAGKGRADGLWQTTCFELFLQPSGGTAYVEINLSPSERWNAYHFDGRREGMREQPMPREPVCTLRLGSDIAIFDAAIPVAGLPAPPWNCSFAAVLEERLLEERMPEEAGGVTSYWALAHRGDAPDFHDPGCFIAAVAAPSGA